jgi:hypothetical protein
VNRSSASRTAPRLVNLTAKLFTIPYVVARAGSFSDRASPSSNAQPQATAAATVATALVQRSLLTRTRPVQAPSRPIVRGTCRALGSTSRGENLTNLIENLTCRALGSTSRGENLTNLIRLYISGTCQALESYLARRLCDCDDDSD